MRPGTQARRARMGATVACSAPTRSGTTPECSTGCRAAPLVYRTHVVYSITCCFCGMGTVGLLGRPELSMGCLFHVLRVGGGCAGPRAPRGPVDFERHGAGGGPRCHHPRTPRSNRHHRQAPHPAARRDPPRSASPVMPCTWPTSLRSRRPPSAQATRFRSWTPRANIGTESAFVALCSPCCGRPRP